MKILIGCEQSQTVCKAFRKLGFEAYSCDILPSYGGKPDWHLQMDVFEAIKLHAWDLAIFHPVCKFMSNAGARWMYPTAGNICPDRFKKAMEAKSFFMELLNSDIKFICVENPLPLKIVELPKESQVIQPYQFGEPFSKRTHLWLKNLPLLKPTELISEYKPYLPSNTVGKKRGHKATFVNISETESSKTFEGIAKAMAEQWGKFLLNQQQNN